MLRGFMFLSEKPILYVLNISESTELGTDLEAAVAKFGLADNCGHAEYRCDRRLRQSRGRTGRDERRRGRRISSSYGLTESGLSRLIRKSYELLGLISFFTVGEDECRAWTIREAHPRGRSRGGHPQRSGRNTSSVPKPSIGTTCSSRARRPGRAPQANCGWKAKTTSCRTAT